MNPATRKDLHGSYREEVLAKPRVFHGFVRDRLLERTGTRHDVRHGHANSGPVVSNEIQGLSSYWFPFCVDEGGCLVPSGTVARQLTASSVICNFRLGSRHPRAITADTALPPYTSRKVNSTAHKWVFASSPSTLEFNGDRYMAVRGTVERPSGVGQHVIVRCG